MLEALAWGAVGGASLVLGAVAGLLASPSQRVIGLIMAFGSGVLISALAFELTQEAFDRRFTRLAVLSARQEAGELDATMRPTR